MNLQWRKATYSSGNGGNCIEVATAGRTVAVRDSKDPDGPRLAFGTRAWQAFAARVKGERSLGPQPLRRTTQEGRSRVRERPSHVSLCRVSVWGGCQRSRAPAARPFAGWRSSSPLPSSGAGTTGTGAVRGRTRRPIFPAAAYGRDRRRRERSSPWLPYPERAGLGTDDLVSDDSGASWSPWWLGGADAT